jgi:leucyl/phenylalanyl-tRNA--protein transferase
MKQELFPSPRRTTPEGLVAVGGNLEVATLLEAYGKGIFPWPLEGMPLLWFSPDPRGVLDFKDFHVPKSLEKFARKHEYWRYTFNRAFAQVIDYCRTQSRKGPNGELQKGTWILPEMQAAYTRLFDQGHILTCECWDGERLIGGIYGVLQFTKKGQMLFSGESMFHLESNASKMVLWKLIEHLKAQGHTWIDIQMTTEVTQMMGGKYIPREEFLQRMGV